jgi:hypothetical protein
MGRHKGLLRRIQESHGQSGSIEASCYKIAQAVHGPLHALNAAKRPGVDTRQYTSLFICIERLTKACRAKYMARLVHHYSPANVRLGELIVVLDHEFGFDR